MNVKGWMIGVVSGLAGLFGLCGCDGGGSDDDDNDGGGGNTNAVPVHAQVAGVWTGTRYNLNGSSPCTLTLTQSGGSIGGNYAETYFVGPVSGSINGDDIDIVVTMSTTPVPHPAGETWTIKGAVNATETKIVGTMRDVGDDLTFTLKVTK